MAHSHDHDHSHDHAHDHSHGHGHSHAPVPPDAELLDPANQSLSDALRRSFGVLKLLMVVMVGLYLLSGWFSVKPGEEGFIVRFGRIVGTSDNEKYTAATLGPGWHWSWPYPFEQWQTVSTQERTIPVDFVYLMTQAEKVTGKLEYKYDNRLSPARDNYLITGDVNIIHATLQIKYRITDSIDYITHVHPAPGVKQADVNEPYKQYPEYTLLSDLARNAVVEAAAAQAALKIRGAGQNEFLQAVGTCLDSKIKALAAAGTPIGISVDPAGGVLAGKSGSVEAIFPPRQVQADFDAVIAAENEKAKLITASEAAAQGQLTELAGDRAAELAAAVEDEFGAFLALTAAESAGQADVAALRAALAAQRDNVEKLLDSAAGRVQMVIKSARVFRDRVVAEARADHDRLMQLKPEFDRDKSIVLSRLRDEMFAEALDNEKVTKWYVPDVSGLIRLDIGRPQAGAKDKNKPDEMGSLGAPAGGALQFGRPGAAGAQ